MVHNEPKAIKKSTAVIDTPEVVTEQSTAEVVSEQSTPALDTEQSDMEASCEQYLMEKSTSAWQQVNNHEESTACMHRK